MRLEYEEAEKGQEEHQAIAHNDDSRVVMRVLALWVSQRVAVGEYTEKPKQPCVQRVQARGEEEASKVLVVALGNTGAHPWAVMVMYLDAGVASATVEGPWRSHNLAGLAIGKEGTF